MRYSVNVDLPFDIDKLVNLYNEKFAWKLDDPALVDSDKRIHRSGGGFLIRVSDPGPDGEVLYWDQHIIKEALDMDMDTIRIFVSNPHQVLSIHRDALNGVPRAGTINVPLVNCDEGINEWFSDEENDFSNEISYYGRSLHPIPGPTPWKVTEVSKLDCIKLFRTDVHHTANNTDNPNRRAILSFRTSENLSWDEMVARVEKYNNRNK